MDGAIATIVASAIGASIALVGLVVSKESKISEFRQQWIDALRANVASFISVMFAATEPLKPAQEGDAAEQNYYAAERENEIQRVMKASELQARIILRFKCDDPEATSMIRVLDVLIKVSTRGVSSKIFLHAVDALVNETQKIVQAEWKKVKRGERVYRLLTRSVALFIVLGVPLLLWYAHHVAPLPR